MLNDKRWTYENVNHSHEFVREKFPEVHTQHIEVHWRDIKRKIPENLTIDLKEQYFYRHMYHYHFDWNNKSKGERFKLLVGHISLIFPGYGRKSLNDDDDDDDDDDHDGGDDEENDQIAITNFFALELLNLLSLKCRI